MAEERAFSWDEEIEAVENEFVDIPAGDYDFKITNFERGYFEGSEKMPACNEAKITYEVNVNGQKGRIKQNLFLHSKSQWQLTGFARAIGHMKKVMISLRSAGTKSSELPVALRLSFGNITERLTRTSTDSTTRKNRVKSGLKEPFNREH